MQLTDKKLKKLALILSALTIFISHPRIGHSAFLYKNYLIRQDSGLDILCDPYIVQKNDWVIKLFQRRGQISEQDFPEFIYIFSQLNPSIKDVNKIMPGQHILIPLKKLSKSSLPGQSTGVVTIPFVTISKLPDVIHENSFTYEVRSGDNVSGIVSQAYTKNEDLSYSEAMKLFKLINPGITDIDKIYPGQAVNIPKSTVNIREWYQSLFNSSEAALNTGDITMAIPTPGQTAEKGAQDMIQSPKNSAENKNFITVASTLNGKMMYKGEHHIPKPGQGDFILDLNRYPVMELPDGTRVLFQENNDISLDDQAALKTHWKNLKFATLPLQSSFEEIMSKVVATDADSKGYKSYSFEDKGVRITIQGKWMVAYNTDGQNSNHEPFENQPLTFISIINPGEKTIPDSIKRYLEKFNVIIKEITPAGNPAHGDASDSCETFEIKKKIIYGMDIKDFVKEFSASLGFQYAENTEISFPYAGIQVKASSNLISTNQGSHLLVDYGDLYGDAISSIKNTGLNVIQIRHEMDQNLIVGEIFKGLNIKYANTSEIMAVNRPENLTVSVHLPGVLYKGATSEEHLITSAIPDDGLVCFLNKIGYRLIVLYKPQQRSAPSVEAEAVDRH